MTNHANVLAAIQHVGTAEFRALAIRDMLAGKKKPTRAGGAGLASEPQVTDGAAGLIRSLADALAPLLVQRVKKELALAPQITPRWLDLESAAKLMNTTKAAVRGMARAKLFPIKKMGGRVMIDIRDLEKSFEENTGWMK